MAAPDPTSKYIFLTGAPAAASLGWEPSDLTVGFSPQLTRYLDGVVTAREGQSAEGQQDAGGSLPAWRLLPLVRQHLRTGLTPASPAEQDSMRLDDQEISFHIPKNSEGASFFTTNNLSFNEIQGQCGQDHTLPSQTEDEVLSQFYEHSFALHEATPSEGPSVPKQASIAISPEEQPLENSALTFASSSFSSSSLDGDRSFTSTESPQQPRPDAPILPSAAKAALIRNLDDIPNAAYLHSIVPQTMTVNLIVGILNIKPPRLVKIRRGAGLEMEIVEILVGDETRSGFGISFWLWPERGEGAKILSGQKQRIYNQSESLRVTLSKLRLQDIILARNVALSSFRGQVYGQFLRMDFAHLYLLYRNPISWLSGENDDNEEIPCIYSPSELTRKESISEHPQTKKTRRVRDWVLHFVAGPTPAMVRRAKAKDGLAKGGSYLAGNELAMMPPDTPQ